MAIENVLDNPPGIELPPGSRFGNYEIVRKLGEGGMGAVYEARRQGLNKRVALKVLTLGGHPAVNARFVQEARISASLEHPNVVGCFDVGEVGGLPFLALEFLDGETLGARLDRGPMTVTEIADVIVPVCSALSTAHRSGIIHRDLKPDNIFLARQVGGVVPKVLDFGIAKARTGSEQPGLTVTASIMGTPGYMSPEQAKDAKHVGPATDQFSLGVMLWEAVTGRGLFCGESSLDVLMAVVTTPAPLLRTVLPGVDGGFEALVARLLERDAAARFGSMREVGAALVAFASPEVRTRWAGEFTGDESALPAQFVPHVSERETAPTIRGAGVQAVVPGYVTGPGVTGPAPASPRRGWILAVAGGLVLAAGALVAAVMWRTSEQTSSVPAVVQQRLAAAAPDAAVAPVRETVAARTSPTPAPSDATRTPTTTATNVEPPVAARTVAEPEPVRPGRHGRVERHPPRGGRRRRPVD